MANQDLLKLTISEIAPMIRTGEVSPVELTEAALAQDDGPGLFATPDNLGVLLGNVI